MKRRDFFHSTMAAAATATVPGMEWLPGLYHVAGQDPADVPAIRGDGGRVTLKGKAIKELRGMLRGRLLLAGQEGYHEARQVLNPSIDKRPAVIVQATGTADVRTAVDFARASSLLLAVKCGGHSPGGQSTCDGGMMIDLSLFRGVRIDPLAKRARVAGGSLLGQLDHEAMAHGLVTPMGTVSHTGVGGLTTGGGFGRVARRFGLALDNVTAADVVSADGVFRRATPDENEDLYWGVRGGGGNFGVVTSFEFRLHPMQRQVIAGVVVFPIEKARDLLTFYADYSVEAPDDLYVDFFMSRPAGGARGSTGLIVCYSGPASQGDRVLAPIRRLGTPMVDGIKAIDYVALQRSGDSDDARAIGTYMKGGFTSEISPDLVTAIGEGLEADPRRDVRLVFQHAGGAITRVPTEATAFVHRYAEHNMMLFVNWPVGDPSAPHIGWARQQWSGLERFTQGFYANEVIDETTAMVNANYRENYRRLVTIKNKYDPGNLFRLNANVQPSV